MKWELALTDDLVRAWKNSKTGAYICDYREEDDGVAYEFSHINEEPQEINKLPKKKLTYYKKKEFYIPSAVLTFELTDKEALFPLKTVLMLCEVEKADEVTEVFLNVKNSELERHETYKVNFNALKKDIQKNSREVKEKLNQFIENSIQDQDISQYLEMEAFNIYLREILENIESKQYQEAFYKKNKAQNSNAIEQIKKNKLNRLCNYEVELEEYVKSHKGKKLSVTEVAKALNVSRKTFYNLELNKRLKELSNKA